MKKKFYTLLFALLAIVVQVQAQVVGVDNARQKATTFLQNHVKNIPTKHRKGMLKAPLATSQLKLVYTQQDELQDNPALYVFQQNGTEGYVIASADERTTPIFAYSETGTFQDAIVASCCLKYLVENFGKEVTYARQHNLPRYESTLTSGNDYPNIEPFTKTDWIQRAPLNNYCPIDKTTGKRSVVGCVASCMAQLMYYHKWPERGVGSHSYQWRDTTLYANFEEKAYRYDLMRDKTNIYNSSYTDEQADAMATINYHCGVACEMNYSSSQSGSFISQNEPLRTFFKYKQVFYSKATETTIGEVHNILAHNLPLACSSSSHQYLVDGYRTGGYVHLNLGSGFTNCWVHFSKDRKEGWYDDYPEPEDKTGWKSWNPPAFYNLYVPSKDVKEVVIDNITYELSPHKRANLVDAQNASGSINIPATINLNGKSYAVTNIPEYAFMNNTAITSVTIQKGITHIGHGAFSGCSNLTSVSIPEGVTHIGGLFRDCYSLTSVNIPEGVLYIPYEMFQDCRSLTNINIPESVTAIDIRAFSGCSSLTNINIPNSVTSIGEGAFAFSGLTSINIPNSVISIGDQAFAFSGLTSINIPNSVISIGDQAFLYCTGLTEINVDENNTTYSSIDGVMFNKSQIKLVLYPTGKQGAYTIPNSVTSIGSYAFAHCTGLTSITIPNSVASIGSYAFVYCTSLTSITIPNFVTSIGEGAFGYCVNLNTIYCHIKEPLTIESYTFYYVPKNTCKLYVPKGSKEKYKVADVWKDFLNIIEFESTGITIVENNDDAIANWYTLDGKPLSSKPEKAGMYVVKMSNGKTKKVMVK